MTRWVVASVCALAVLLATPRAAAEAPPGIDWFEGSVEQAFERAKREDKPLFLYWGAVWCPPCVEIRQTVFKSPRFRAQTKLFLPVYLDGDTERAQVWSDRFDTRVYPTMIVFNPAGEEVTRLNASVDVAAYNDVLDLSLDSMRPMTELARAAMADPGALGGADLQRLAYYSWDDGEALPEDAEPAFFLRLADAAAGRDAAAAARLYLQYLVALAAAAERGERVRKEGVERITGVLGERETALAGWDYLILPERLLPALDASGETLESLQGVWADALLRARYDERLSVKNRLYAWRPALVFRYGFESAEATRVAEPLAKTIRAEGEFARESVAGTHGRQSVINTISNVYLLAGLTDDARDLLRAEIRQSKTPYYFMGSLAALEERQGNDAVALEWRRKAYEASTGPATRIRWWASYVQALTRLAPAEAARIRQAAFEVFDPAAGMSDLFVGANFRNLNRARTSLAAWAEGSDTARVVLDDFDAKVRQACRVEPDASLARSNCGAML